MFSRNNLIFFHSDDELPSTAETEEEVGCSVSHTAPTTAGQPVFWKRKLTIVTSSKELNDVIKDAVKNTKGDVCPFCTLRFVLKSERNRHMLKGRRPMLNANQKRL